MEIKISIPTYTVDKGFKFHWENGFKIETKIINGEFTITANKEGLISLATQLLTLAQEEIPNSYHIHLDEFNALEDSSVGITIEKVL